MVFCHGSAWGWGVGNNGGPNWLKQGSGSGSGSGRAESGCGGSAAAHDVCQCGWKKSTSLKPKKHFVNRCRSWGIFPSQVEDILILIDRILHWREPGFNFLKSQKTAVSPKSQSQKSQIRKFQKAKASQLAQIRIIVYFCFSLFDVFC